MVGVRDGGGVVSKCRRTSCGDGGGRGGGGDGGLVRVVVMALYKKGKENQMKKKKCNGSHFNVFSFIGWLCLIVICWVCTHGRLALCKRALH